MEIGTVSEKVDEETKEEDVDTRNSVAAPATDMHFSTLEEEG